MAKASILVFFFFPLQGHVDFFIVGSDSVALYRTSNRRRTKVDGWLGLYTDWVHGPLLWFVYFHAATITNGTSLSIYLLYASFTYIDFCEPI